MQRFVLHRSCSVIPERHRTHWDMTSDFAKKIRILISLSSYSLLSMVHNHQYSFASSSASTPFTSASLVLSITSWFIPTMIMWNCRWKLSRDRILHGSFSSSTTCELMCRWFAPECAVGFCSWKWSPSLKSTVSSSPAQRRQDSVPMYSLLSYGSWIVCISGFSSIFSTICSLFRSNCLYSEVIGPDSPTMRDISQCQTHTCTTNDSPQSDLSLEVVAWGGQVRSMDTRACTRLNTTSAATVWVVSWNMDQVWCVMSHTLIRREHLCLSMFYKHSHIIRN